MNTRMGMFLYPLVLVVTVWCMNSSPRQDDGADPSLDVSSAVTIVDSVAETSMGQVVLEAGVDEAVLQWGTITLSGIQLRLIHSYPLAVLRERLHTFVHPDEGMEPIVRIVFDAGTRMDWHWLATAHYNEQGDPVMSLNAVALYEHWLDMKEVDGAFEDFLLIVELHEVFHLRDQGVDMRFAVGAMSPNELADIEIAAYIDGIAIAKAMIEEGRATNEALSPLMHSVYAYAVGADDPTHPIWVQFGRMITQRENTFSQDVVAWSAKNHSE